MNYGNSGRVAVGTGRTFWRLVRVILLGTIFLIGFGVTLLVWPATGIAADGPDQADIVIQFDENNTIVRRISFTAPISGYEALRLTGLDIITETTPFGIAICGIEGVGDTAGSCFDTGFWSSYFWNGSDWETYLVGASGSVINDGAVELWSWQAGFVPLDPLPSHARMVAAAQALDWLRGQQSASDGGYGNPSATVQSLLAVGANKYDAGQWRISDVNPSLLDYWSRTEFGSPTNAAAFAATHAGRAGLLALAVAGVEQNPESFAGLNLVVSLTNFYDPPSGVFDEADIHQAWAMLGYAAAGQTVPMSATRHLVANGFASGGWEWAEGMGSDTNTTALALQALIAGGECITSPNVANGLNYLKFAQKSDGGFGYSPLTAGSDSNSTAWAVQALLAAGKDPAGVNWTVNGNNPFDYLLDRQLTDGSFEWQPGLGANQLATQQAISALLEEPLPMHLASPDQSQCFVSPPTQRAGDIFRHWLPLIVK